MLSNYEKEMKNRMKSSDVRKLEKTLSLIRDIEEEFVSLDSQGFLKETEKLKNRLNNKENLDDLLPRAYALAITAIRKYHPGHFELRDVQIMAAIALHYGTCVELGTGEGKTVSFVLPAYLNALTGKKVHIASSNNYLSKRDYDELKPIYDTLGVRVSYVPEEVGNVSYDEGKTIKQRKREAYQNADICYASNSTFAFDYLNDSTTMSRSDLVLDPNQELGFALIDEVDDILLDSAKIPFIISEKEKVYTDNMTLLDLSRTLNVSITDLIQKTRELGIRVEKDTPLSYEQAKNISYYGYHIELLTSEIKYRRYADQFVRSFLYQEDSRTSNTFYDCDLDGNKAFQTFENLKGNPYENYMISDSEQQRLAKILNSKNLIIRSTSQGKRDFFITSRGYRIFENYFFRIHLSENRELLRDIAPKILKDSRFSLGSDYYLGAGNVLLFTETGLEKATNFYPELKKIRDDFAVENNYNRIQQFVMTSLDAYLNYKLNKEYAVVDDARNGFSVQVITAGRIAPGRVFGNGYQQAIEIKEKVKRKDRNFQVTEENRTKASISQKGFYTRYGKIAGMSGTSSIYGFAKLYDLRTVEIPRSAYYEFYSDTKKKKINKLIEIGKMKAEDRPKCPKKVVQRPDAFFATDREKYEIIYRSIMESQQKIPRQPVLITTTSVQESLKLAEYLRNRGFSKFQVLNALTDKEKEASIIAHAGEVGRVTISTEMAGRGTDIKLGGDREKTIDLAFQKVLQKNPSFINLPEYQKKQIRSSLEMQLEKSNVILPSARQKQIHDLLSEVGGLRVICDGHFALERVDNQVKGRTGRGGEGGEVMFVSSPSDLIRIGSPKERVEKLFTRLMNKDESAYSLLNKEIKRVQAENEEGLIKRIEDTNELDTVVSSYRNKLRKRRSELVSGYESKNKNGVSVRQKVDYSFEIERVFEKIIRNIIISHIPDGISKKSFSYNASEANLDVFGLSLELEAFLGIKVDPNHLYQFENLKEIQDVATVRMQEYHRGLVTQNPMKQKQIDKEILLSYIDKTLDASADLLDDMEFQKKMNQIVKYEGVRSSPVIFFDAYIKMIERETLKESIRFAYGKNLSDDKRKKLEELLDKRYEKRQDEGFVQEENRVVEQFEKKEEVKIEKKKPSHKNLKIRPVKAFTVLSNPAKLVKKSVKFLLDVVEISNETLEKHNLR